MRILPGESLSSWTQRKEKIVKKLGQPDFANYSGQFVVWYCIVFYFMGGWQILLWPLWLIPPGEIRQELWVGSVPSEL